ncbi:hypothetical protein MMPV_008561 [Pyropia vietnamensis]
MGSGSRRRRDHDSGDEGWSDGNGSGGSAGWGSSSDEEMGVVVHRRERINRGGSLSRHTPYGREEPPRRSSGSRRSGSAAVGADDCPGSGGGRGGGDGNGRSKKRTRSPPPPTSTPPVRYERADDYAGGRGQGGGGRKDRYEPPGTPGRSSRAERSRGHHRSSRGGDGSGLGGGGDGGTLAAARGGYSLSGVGLGGLSTSLRAAGGLVHTRFSSLLSPEVAAAVSGGGGGDTGASRRVSDRSGGTLSRRSTRSGRGGSVAASKAGGGPSSVLGRLRGALPVSGQGWGLLLLSVLLLFYLIDFFAILDAPSMTPLKAVAGGPATVAAASEGGGAGAPLAQPVRMTPLRDDADDAAPSDATTPAVPPPPPAAVVGASAADGGASGAAAAPISPEGGGTPAAAIAPGGGEGTASTALGGESVGAAAAGGPAVGADGRPLHPFNRNIDELQVPAGTGKLDKEAVAGYYRRLVQAYLAPFANGIFRQLFFDILRRKTYSLTPPGANKGIQSMLLQVIDNKVYLLDPYEVPKNAKPFYRARINEIIWLLSRLATAGRIRNTEFLIAIHDCVQTVNREHTYRGAHFTESNPVFTIVSCNFSDNIPFPMWEANADRGGGFESWDEFVKEYAVDPTPWASKVSKAVFRGGNRPSMYFKDKSEADSQCNHVGRTRLLHLAQTDPSAFDVSVGGTCGGNHSSLSRLSWQEQHHYKYVLYAEGNCFWADRMNKQMFGPSAVIKQETPCGQFWEPLLRPFTHYIPTDFFFDDTATQVAWAVSHDAEVQSVVAAANEFAWNFLTLTGIETYVEVLLDEYTKLLVDPAVKLETGAVDVTGQKV